MTRPARNSKRWRIWLVAGTIAVLLVGWFTGLPSTAFEALASRSLAERDTARAVSCLGWAQRFQSGDPEIEFLLARAARQRGEMDESREHLERAWKGGYPVASLHREQILALAQSGQMREAEPALTGLLMNPQGDAAEICEAFATGFLKTYRFSDTLQLLDARLRDQPNDSRAWLLRAKANVELQQWTTAAEDLQNVLRACPGQCEAAYLMGGVLLKQKDPEAALGWFAHAAGDPQFHLRVGIRRLEAFRMLTQYDAARESARVLLALQPDHVPLLLEAGKLETDVGAYPQAVEYLAHALERSPNSPEVHYALAVALRAARRADEAKPHFHFAAQARERLLRAHDLEDVVAKNPEDAVARREIGTIFLDYDQPERGIVWLQSALDYDPQNAAAHRRLADYYETRSEESAEFAALARKHRVPVSGKE